MLPSLPRKGPSFNLEEAITSSNAVLEKATMEAMAIGMENWSPTLLGVKSVD